MSLRQFTPPSFLPAFTHRPGTKISLPGPPHVIAVFPTALRLYTCRTFDARTCQRDSLSRTRPAFRMGGVYRLYAADLFK